MDCNTDQLKLSPKLKRALTRFYGLQRVGANSICAEMNGWLSISLKNCPKDMDNIFSLVWKCVHELNKSEYRKDTISGYILCGFAPILFYFTTHNIMKYDKSVISDFSDDVRKICQCGECGVSMIYNLRTAAKFLQTYHDSGALLPPDEEIRRREKHKLSATFEELISQYKARIGEFRNVSEKTIKNECHSVKTFLWGMEQCGVASINDISHKNINECFTKLASGYVDGAKTIASSARHFLTFLHEVGLMPINYSVTVPQSFPHRRKMRFGFTPSEIPNILGAVNRKTKAGKRDYVIMLIAARTGLRACDVAKIKLSEIDWRTKEIRMVQQKNRVATTLPLTAEVGNAIVDYFENARGKVCSPYMFPLSKDIGEHIKSPTISALTTKHMNIAGIDDFLPYRGVHSFRRSFGKRMLDASLTPDMVMEMLGQINPNSITPYTAIYEDGLRRCSLSLSSVNMEAVL